MKPTILPLGLAAFFLAVGCAHMEGHHESSGTHEEEEYEEEGEEVTVPVDQLPAAVLAAAKAAAPGLVVDEAVREEEDGTLIYSLEGHDSKGPVEVNVTPEGKVVNVEREKAKSKGDEDEDDDD